jgi:hypothetical protein
MPLSRKAIGWGEGIVSQFPMELTPNNSIDRNDVARTLGRGIRATGDSPVVNQAWLSSRLRGRLNVMNTR